MPRAEQDAPPQAEPGAAGKRNEISRHHDATTLACSCYGMGVLRCWKSLVIAIPGKGEIEARFAALIIADPV